MEAKDHAQELKEKWDGGELTEVAYRIAALYGANDYRLVSDTMAEFKKLIEK